MLSCNGTIKQGTQTLVFQVKSDGVNAELESCAQIVSLFRAERAGDLPGADPNAA